MSMDIRRDTVLRYRYVIYRIAAVVIPGDMNTTPDCFSNTE